VALACNAVPVAAAVEVEQYCAASRCLVKLDLVQSGIGKVIAVQRSGRYLDVPLLTSGEDRFPRRGSCGERGSPLGEQATVS
jgi:hypothetical protein